MPIEPETKNWTWVLEKACDECGFDAPAFPRTSIGAESMAVAERWPALLADARVRLRPDDHTWSALEYACHVRDVFRLGVYRARMMLDEDRPQFANWDQDAAAVEDRYCEQDPATVATEIVGAAKALAAVYDSVGGEEWAREGLRSDGSLFTVESFGKYFLHDPYHHVVDVHRGYQRIGGST